MNRRDRCVIALAGGMPDRPPISFDVQPNCELTNMQAVYKHFGVTDKNGLYTAAGIDGFSVWEWNSVMAEYAGKPKVAEDGTELDFWGNLYPGHFGLAKCNTIEEVKAHNWPKIEDFDFSKIHPRAVQIREQDMPVSAGHLGLGYQMHNTLRGNEAALFDVSDEEYMEAFMHYLTDFTVKYIEELLKAGKGLIDVVRADDDMGTMDRLMISPAMWRKYYKPAWKKAIDVVHKHGARIWFHSCGYVQPLLEDFIEIGVDCWNPFPPYVKGNDHDKLKEFRKGRIALDGGVNHLVMIKQKPADVVDETKRVLDTFAPDGGLLIGPSQVFTKDMPPENIIAFLDTAVNY